MHAVTIKGKELSVPIIQGGMGVGVSLGRLAGHVAACGGMGVISAAHPGYREPDFYINNDDANFRALEAEIKLAKEISKGRGMIGVNVMVALNSYSKLVRVAAQAGADAIISGAGLPLDLPVIVYDKQIAMAPIVSSGKAATLICRVWEKRYNKLPDFIVVEGCEAGGHLGYDSNQLKKGTAPTLDAVLIQVLKALQFFEKRWQKRIPVFAAGGIYTNADIKRVLALGAAGVQISTRFIATHECDASEAYKQAFLNAKPEDILIVTSPVGMPGRALRSPLIKKLEQGEKSQVTRCVNCLRPCNPTVTSYCITDALIAAVKGDWENGLFFCGSNAHRMDSLLSVEELMHRLITGEGES